MTEEDREAEPIKKMPSSVELLTIAPIKPNFPFFTSAAEALTTARDYLGQQGEIVKTKCEEKQDLMTKGYENKTLDPRSSEFSDLAVEAERLGNLMWFLVRLSRENSSETEVLNQIKAEIAAVEALKAALGKVKNNKTLKVDDYQIDVSEARKVVEVYDSDQTSGLKRIVRVYESPPPGTSPEDLPIKAVESLPQPLSENVESEIIIPESELKPEPKPEKPVEEALSLEPETPNAQIVEEVAAPVVLEEVKEVEKVVGVEVPDTTIASLSEIQEFIKRVRENRKLLSNDDNKILKRIHRQINERFPAKNYFKDETRLENESASLLAASLNKLYELGL